VWRGAGTLKGNRSRGIVSWRIGVRARQWTDYLHAMRRHALSICAVALSLAACHGSSSTPASGATAREPEPLEHALSGLAAQHVAVLPTYAVRVMPGLPWGASVGRPTDIARTLDADIVAAFQDRSIGKTWIFPQALEQAYRRNSTYATNPYELAEEPLRLPSLGFDDRLPEPLATQLRTLIALHDDVRLVLAPVELKLEPSGTGGRGVLRLVLVDPRLSTVRWTGEVASPVESSFGPVISASIASKLANVVATP
jgi:hypothetical protein